MGCTASIDYAARSDPSIGQNATVRTMEPKQLSTGDRDRNRSKAQLQVQQHRDSLMSTELDIPQSQESHAIPSSSNILLQRQLSRQKVVDVDVGNDTSKVLSKQMLEEEFSTKHAISQRSTNGSPHHMYANGASERGDLSRRGTGTGTADRRRLTNNGPFDENHSPQLRHITSNELHSGSRTPSRATSFQLQHEVDDPELIDRERGNLRQRMHMRALSTNPDDRRATAIRSAHSPSTQTRVAEQFLNQQRRTLNHPIHGLWNSNESHSPVDHSIPIDSSSSETEVGNRRRPLLNARRSTYQPTTHLSVDYAMIADERDRPISPSSTNRSQGRGKRLALIVDSLPVSQRLNSVVLYRRGYQVDLADDGEDAIEKATRQHYDIILMEESLPGMTGVAACRAIRSIEQDRRDTPCCIMLMTSRVDPQSMKEYKVVKFNAILEKGCVLAEVIPQAIEDLLKNPNFLLVDSKGRITQSPRIDEDILDGKQLNDDLLSPFPLKNPKRASFKVLSKRASM